MTFWLDRLARLGQPAVLVTVAAAEGSTPREAGAKMVVSAEASWGTIGGGHLELKAIARARDLLAAGGGPALETYALGPSLGQCCGGRADLAYERVETGAGWVSGLLAAQDRNEAAVLLTSLADGSKVVLDPGAEHGVVGLDLASREALAAARGLARADPATAAGAPSVALLPVPLLYVPPGGAAPFLVEPVRPAGFRVMLFGAGHVGRALARVLGVLPARVLWVDPRPEQFPADIPDNVTVEVSPLPETLVADGPAGACWIVMTHSHALDLDLCAMILGRADARYVGLIGSTTKRRTFEKRLRRRGLDDAVIAALACPIGLPGLGGKHPGEIAVAVAAQLLALGVGAGAHGTAPTPRVAATA